jgi:hypothetical protein
MKTSKWFMAGPLVIGLSLMVLAGCDNGTTDSGDTGTGGGTTGTTGFGESTVVTITIKNNSGGTLDKWCIDTQVPGENTAKYYPSGKFSADWGSFSPELQPGGQRTLSPVTIGNRSLTLRVHQVGQTGSAQYKYYGKQELPWNLTIVYNGGAGMTEE